MSPDLHRTPSPERFEVVYRIKGGASAALTIANDICVEQTVEFPIDLVPAEVPRERILGRIETFETDDESGHRASISYATDTVGGELTQLLNVVYGNYSMKPGVRVERLNLPRSLLRSLVGPRFGSSGIRSLVGVPRRPLLCTALKPLGLPAAALADLAYRLAIGGVDVIKDDHGLADQAMARFEERVARCIEAVERANRETGRRCIYVPNVTAVGDVTIQRARVAKSGGAGGILVAPGLAGFGMMAQLAADKQIALPIMSHPAFLGSFVSSPDVGISPFALFGQITRLAGADATIFPNYGGRFSFSPDACRDIAEGAMAPMDPIKPIFPTPGGGMAVSRVPEMLDFYGRDVILLVGGGLHQHGPDIVANCRAFRRLVDSA